MHPSPRVSEVSECANEANFSNFALKTDGQPLPVSSTMTLKQNQVARLRTVLDEKVDIHGRGNFPTISVRLLDLIIRVRHKLRQAEMPPKCVKLNGGAASFVASADAFPYADIDLIFPMESGDADSFDKVRDAVFDTIVEMLPDATNKTKMNADTLKDIYIRKMVKVSSNDDRWSLFALNNEFGRCIELKFVDKMKRQFEFSVDSFQIRIDPILENPSAQRPTVVIESMYGDIHMALSHLKERLIDTRKPEEIRGGGLLKYCHLLTRGYKAARPDKCRQLERYMCSRFFIDFSDVATQEQKLKNYLDNHFGSNSDQWSLSGDETDSEASTSQAPSSIMAQNQLRYDFLMLLYRVISESTVCLMSHDRKMTLQMIDRLAFQVSMSMYSCQQPAVAGHIPRTTLFYLQPNTSRWIPVV